ncbi:MAG: CPBP family glutamic-type intramembrane protease [Ferruginibacter sp.]
MNKQIAVSILTFFLIAFILTFAFSQLPLLMLYSVNITEILCGAGPLISGLLCYKIFKTPTTYSLDGKQPIKSWLLVIVSVITFMLTNTRSSFSSNLVFAITQLLYCFGEEFGWRHYLQSATKKSGRLLQALIIGCIWFFWHFSWLQDPAKAMTGSGINAPVFAVILSAIVALSLISFLLGFLMNRTTAVLLPTILHFAVKTNLPTLIITFTLVIIAHLTWKKYYLKEKVLV